MADKKISQLTNITGATVNDFADELPIVDSSSNETKAITRAELFQSVNGASFDGDVSLRDADRLLLGDSGQMNVRHDGDHGFVGNGTGDLYLVNTADNRDVHIQTDNATGGYTTYFLADGSTGEAMMNYYGAQKLTTSSTGVTISGNITAQSNAPLLFLHETDGPSVNAQTSLAVSNGHFAMQTRSSTGVYVANDYYSNKNGSGAVDHSWRIGGNEKLLIDSDGVDVTGDLTVDTATLHVDSTNNRVGFGLTNPQSEVHIKGSTPQFRLQPTADTQNSRLEFCNAAGTIQSRILSGGSLGSTIQLDGDVEVVAGHNVTLPKLEVFSNSNSPLGNVKFGRDATQYMDFHGGASGNFMTSVTSTGNPKPMFLKVQEGASTADFRFSGNGNLIVTGALSKGSGSFKIDHPLKPETHHLVHSFVEAPQADNIYRGKVALVDGSATVNLDEAGRMTEGTFVALNGNIQCFTSNEDGWTAIRGSVSGNTLTVEAQDASCTDIVSWLVIGERHDPHMLDTDWTDAAGRVITEPEKQTEEEE